MGLNYLTISTRITNSKYDRLIKAAQCKYYDNVSDIHEREGDLTSAKTFLAKRLKAGFSSHRLPHSYLLMKFIKLQIRIFYSQLRLLRNFVYSHRS